MLDTAVCVLPGISHIMPGSQLDGKSQKATLVRVAMHKVAVNPISAISFGALISTFCNLLHV